MSRGPVSAGAYSIQNFIKRAIRANGDTWSLNCFAYRQDALPCNSCVELNQGLHQAGFLACHAKHDVFLGTDFAGWK